MNGGGGGKTSSHLISSKTSDISLFSPSSEQVGQSQKTAATGVTGRV